jgi:aminoglycoside phosphotransferase (APT) family kinase protein
LNRASSTDADVRSIVAGIGERVAPGRELLALRKEPSQFATTARLWNLQAVFSDRTKLSIVHKESGRRSRLRGAPRTVASFAYDPQRETRVYERLLAHRHLETPLLYASDVQPKRGRYWMFLEHVPGMQLRWTTQPGAWQRAAAWLARAHARLPTDGDTSGCALVIHDAHYYRRWLRRAQVFTDGRDRYRKTRLSWLARKHAYVIDVLTGLPRTVLHGEFYPSNILVDESTTDGRISVIDWEMAAIGPAVTDLAALTGGTVTDENRRSILASYLSAAPAASRQRGEALASEALGCARVQLAIQWLGWARDWSPPEEQRHDWLSEAVDIGETMGW